jgi:uncharacterized protein YbjQ (UPF0145 family)
MLLVTTDVLPPWMSYRVLGVVHAGYASRAVTGRHLTVGANVDDKMRKMLDELASRAQAIGANGVIGIRHSAVTGDVQVLMGTAVYIQSE